MNDVTFPESSTIGAFDFVHHRARDLFRIKSIFYEKIHKNLVEAKFFMYFLIKNGL